MRKIIHIDMDCFYAAIEMRDRPELTNVPVAVGGRPGSRGVLCTANYPARKFGVRSAMASSTAKRLCPELVILPVRMSHYREISRDIFSIYQEYTDLVQPLSLDEAFLDVTDCDRCKGSATLIAAEIRDRIRTSTGGLTGSAGVAPNKFIAKIASDWNKPDGQLVVPPDKVDAFVRDLPVNKIWGVGKVTAARLESLGLETCGDIQQRSEKEMKATFGKFGTALWELSHGIDERPVVTERRRKSFSLETTYHVDIDHESCRVEIVALRERLLERLKAFMADRPEHMVKSAFVKIKFADFRSTTVDRAGSGLELDDLDELLRQGLQRSELDVRLLGCGVRFHDPDRGGSGQLDFFDLLGV
jgi:DNA polymerase-4